MNIAMLSTLVAIVDRGSFAAAAKVVGCTPSAVSLQVKQLEAYFGELLFDRSARAVRPTPFALKASAVARELVTTLQTLRTRSTVGVSGQVRLGAIASVQADTLPQVLRWIRDRHAALQVRISLDDSDALIGHLKSGRIDAAVVVRPRHGGSSRLAWQNLARQPFVLLAPPGTPASSPQDVMRRHDVIRYDTTLTGGRIAAEYVRRAFPDARCVMDVRSVDAIVAMVSAGLGVSIVPRPRQLLLDAHGVRAISLGRNSPARQIALVRRRADGENRNIDAVFNAFVAAYASREPT